MSEHLILEILTPEKRVLTTETPFVTLPGTLGELGILPHHIPLMTTVESGVLSYESEGRRKQAAVHYGYARVEANKVTVLSEMVELADEVDLERAHGAEQRAREALAKLVSQQDAEEGRLKKYEAKIGRALVRQRLG